MQWVLQIESGTGSTVSSVFYNERLVESNPRNFARWSDQHTTPTLILSSLPIDHTLGNHSGRRCSCLPVLRPPIRYSWPLETPGNAHTHD